MKKLIQILIVTAIGCFSVAAQDRMAAQSADFLGGNGSLFLTNGGGATFNLVGVGYSNSQGIAVFSLTNQYSTNVLTAGPGGAFTNSYVYYGAAWQDVPSFSDVNGNNASASIAISFHGSSANSTNTLSFTFVPLTKKIGTVLSAPATAGNGGFTFVILSTGTGQQTILTNMTTGLMQGAMGWRCSLATNPATTGGQGIYIDQMTLNGYR